jgi:hypothetical protein
MSSLDREARNVQNPAFGATVLAAFLQGHYEADEMKGGTPLPYLFLVLPMIFHSEVYRLLSETRTGLRQFAEKFVSSEFASTDLLLSLGSSAIRLRRLTADSLGIMLLSGLATLDSQHGRLLPRKVNVFSARPDIPNEAEQGRKLGRWFAELSPFEIGSILKVVF